MALTTDRRLLLAAVLAWIAVAVLSIAIGPPLGHDESAFSVAARGDAPAWVYRSAGVIWIAKVGVALGGAEWQLRLASALLGTTLVLAAFLVGRAAFSERTGAWAAAVLAGAHPFALRSAELIGDLPATAAALAGIALLAGELAREEGPRWRLVLCGPAFAAAFYLRYGSAPVVAMAGGAALLLWWRAIVRRPWPVIAAAALFVLLLAPHFIQSLRTTGTLFGILEVSSKMPRRAYPGEGLVTYLTSNPFRFYGALVAPLLVTGLAGLVRLPARWRPSVFLGAIAVGQIVALGVQSHAQPRYIFVATVLLVVLGIDFLQRCAPVRLRVAALPLVIAAWIGVMVTVPFYSRFLSDARAPIVASAAAIRADAGDRPCFVVAKVVTQLMWYTGCHEHLLRAFDNVPPWTADRAEYVISLPKAQVGIDGLLAVRPGRARELTVAHPRGKVWAVLPPGP